MSGPPKGEEPSALWLRLSERPRPTVEVDFPTQPGKEAPGRLFLRVLTESELHAVRANAEKTAVEMLSEPGKPGEKSGLGYEDIYRNELLVELVCQAARRQENPLFPLFPSPRHARKVLTSDELGVLVAQYNAFQQETSPLLSEMTAAQCEAWIKVLKEGGSRLPLARLSGAGLCDLVMYLVSTRESPTGTGSSGTPPGEPSTETPSFSADLVSAEDKAQR